MRVDEIENAAEEGRDAVLKYRIANLVVARQGGQQAAAQGVLLERVADHLDLDLARGAVPNAKARAIALGLAGARLAHLAIKGRGGTRFVKGQRVVDPLGEQGAQDVGADLAGRQSPSQVSILVARLLDVLGELKDEKVKDLGLVGRALGFAQRFGVWLRKRQRPLVDLERRLDDFGGRFGHCRGHRHDGYSQARHCNQLDDVLARVKHVVGVRKARMHPGGVAEVVDHFGLEGIVILGNVGVVDAGRRHEFRGRLGRRPKRQNDDLGNDEGLNPHVGVENELDVGLLLLEGGNAVQKGRGVLDGGNV